MNKATIDVEGRFIDNISGPAKKAKATIEYLGNAADEKLKKLSAKRELEMQLQFDDRATAKIKKAIALGGRLDGKVWTAMAKLKDNGALQTIQKIQAGGKSLAGKTWTTIIRVKDYALAPINKLRSALFSVKTLVGAIFAGMAANQLVMQPIGLADAYSSAKIGFSTLLGESRGAQMMNDLDEFAKATPFKSSEVISQTQRMLAMGWDAEAIIDDMRTIGDAAAATGKGEMGLQQIVTALAQIKTKGKLSTEELNQLAEAGVSAKRYIAENLGYGQGDEGIAKMTKDLENGAIQSGKALEALLTGMKEYQGMMDKTANETVSGLKSQLEDTFEINILRRWGQGLQEGAKQGFGSIVSLLDKADGALTSFGDTIQEIGSTISTYAANKLKDVVETITEITDSYDFKNAGLGDKIKMLWSGAVADPLKEWWNGGGREKTAETAGEIGSWMGKMLSDGLLAILGATDVLADAKIGENGGMTIAQSFVKGFTDNFDGYQITNAFVDAIKNIWDALPWWGKALIGGNIATNALTGIAGITSAIGTRGTINAAGAIEGASGLLGAIGTRGAIIDGKLVGASGMLGTIGRVGATSAGGYGLLGGLSNLGYGLIGKGTMGYYGLASGATVGGGAAALAGAAGIAGGVMGGAALIKGGIDLYGAHKAYQAGDETEGRARSASGGWAIGGVAAGAAIGSLIAPGIGTLIGAGVGGLAGWIAGDHTADSIRKAKYESEAMKNAISDSNVSAEELARTFEREVYYHLRKSFGDIELSMTEINRIADQIVWGDTLEVFDTFNASVKTAKSNLEAMNAAGQDTDKWMWKAGLGVKFNKDEQEEFLASFDEYVNAAQSAIENKHYEFTSAVKLLLGEEGAKGILSSGDAFYAAKKELASKLSKELSDSLKVYLGDGVIELNEQKEIASLQQQIADITTQLANAEFDSQIDLMTLKFGGGNLSYESFESLMGQMQTTIDERLAASDDAFVASVSSLKIQLADGAIEQTEYDAAVQELANGYKATIKELKASVVGLELDLIADSQYGDLLGYDAVNILNNALENSLARGINPAQWTPEQARQFLGIDSLSEEAAGALSTMLGGVADQILTLTVSGTPKMLDDKGEEISSEQIKFNTEKALRDALPDEVGKTIDVKITPNITIDSSSISLPYDLGLNAPGNFRGGIVGYANGGMVRGGSKLITVAEEGSPEMIIPLSAQRRERGLDLWTQAGHMLGVPGFARGGLVGNAGLQVPQYVGSDAAGAGQTVQVDVGGITVELNVQGTDSQSIATAVKAQAGEIAEAVAGIFADAFEAQFKNIPVRGGAR